MFLRASPEPVAGTVFSCPCGPLGSTCRSSCILLEEVSQGLHSLSYHLSRLHCGSEEAGLVLAGVTCPSRPTERLLSWPHLSGILYLNDIVLCASHEVMGLESLDMSGSNTGVAAKDSSMT